MLSKKEGKILKCVLVIKVDRNLNFEKLYIKEFIYAQG